MRILQHILFLLLIVAGGFWRGSEIVPWLVAVYAIWFIVSSIDRIK